MISARNKLIEELQRNDKLTQITKINIEKISLSEVNDNSFLFPKKVDFEELSNQPDNIFYTSIYANIYETCLINNPLATEKKIKVYIPTLKVNISDQVILLSQVVEIIKKLNDHHSEKENIELSGLSSTKNKSVYSDTHKKYKSSLKNDFIPISQNQCIYYFIK